MINPLLRPSQRIESIDFWRGVYLLMIYANHVPGNVFSYLTLRNWGFADSAEPFIFISGFSAMLAFGPYFEKGGAITGLCRTLKRVWQLFCAHVLVVFAMSALIAVAGDYMDSKPIMEQFNFSPFFVETDVAVVRLLKLGYMPNLGDILPLYIVLVFFFPLAWFLIRISPWLALAASFCVWLWANITGVSFANYPEGGTWYFNPLGWQALFVAGMVAYNKRNVLGGLIRSNILFGLSIAFCLFALLAAAPWAHFEAFSSYRVVPPEVLALDQKTNLSWIRIVHFFALAFLAARLFPAQSVLWKNKTVQLISLCGRHALAVFCVGVVLSLFVHIILQLGQISPVPSAFIVFAGGLGLLLLSIILEKAKKRLGAVSAASRAGRIPTAA